MSWTKHNIITITSFSEDDLNKAIIGADLVFSKGMITKPLMSPTNGFYTFMIGPDGSKEGWPESDEGDAQRKQYLNWLREKNLMIHACHISFDDNPETGALVEDYIRYGEQDDDAI